MAKLAIVAALLIGLVAVASAYTTTITTTVVEEDNPRGGGSQQRRCEEQFQEQQQLRHCQMYLRQQCGQGEDDISSLRMVVNPQQQQHRRECCKQLENIDNQCRCESIRQMMRQQQQEGQMGGQEMEKMAQMAMNLPRMCNMEPQQCQIRAVFF
ncbi:hypothetical protein LguiA_023253 [Lonicera macranthoides]